MEGLAKDIIGKYPSVLELLKALGPPSVAMVAALVALGAAVIASFIQFIQWRTASERLRFDLFQKRIEVYDRLYTGFLELQYRTGVPQEELRLFHLAVSASKFLFDSDISEQIESGNTVLGRLREYLGSWKYEDDKESPDPERLAELSEAMRPLAGQIDQLLQRFPTLFKDSMYFGNITK